MKAKRVPERFLFLNAGKRNNELNIIKLPLNMISLKIVNIVLKIRTFRKTYFGHIFKFFK